ncbi:hypothetical protein [Paenibacillus naphthalenovorans]|uniref:hypothetical protein n=1 Tax=Paenibacillus naphthalenovorans TaxID=162209 RepID=UPI003D2CB790
MARNEFFPHWITANVILEDLLNRFWKIEVKQSSSNIDSCEIIFLDPKIIYYIPPEDRETFRVIYQKFGGWALELFQERFEKYLYLPNDPYTWLGMTNEINSVFAEAQIEPKEKLKEMLGLRPKIELKMNLSFGD